MTANTKQITCEHIDQLFTSDDGFGDLFDNSDVKEQKELGSLNRPETLLMPSLVFHSRQYREKTSPISRQSSKCHNRCGRTLLSRVVISSVLILLLWIGIFALSKSNSSPSPQLTPVSFHSKQLPTRYVTKNIEDLSLGDRVLGRNPEVSDANRALFGPEPTPEMYLGYFLALPKENDTMMFVELLRPNDWLNGEITEMVELENEEGELDEAIFVWLELPEMGTVGWAELFEVFQLNEFESGTGNLVTGTFCHLAPETIDLVIEDIDPIGCTPNHPFWSVDRQAYIDAGELFDGERILLYSGETKRIVQKLSRPDPEIVYNIEVFGEHVYHVTSDGVLVHNNCPKPNNGKAKPHGNSDHDAAIDELVRKLRKLEAKGLVKPGTIRKNQAQVDSSGTNKLGKNRPDVQFEWKDGTKANVEFDRSIGNNQAHQSVIQGLDPKSKFYGRMLK